MGTKLGKALPWSCHPWSQWPFDQVTNVRPRDKLKKIYISTLASLLTTKLDRVLTSKMRFRTQTRKSSPTSCTKLHCFKIILRWYLVWWGKYFVFNTSIVFSLAFINSCLKRLRIQGKSLNPGKETSCHRNLIKIYHKNIWLHINIKLTSFLQDINGIKFIYGFE